MCSSAANLEGTAGPLVLGGTTADVSTDRPPDAEGDLAEQFRRREDEFLRLRHVTATINRGVGLEEVLDYVYREFQGIIPFNRIGFGLIDEASGQVVARWARSDRPLLIGSGYTGASPGPPSSRSSTPAGPGSSTICSPI